MSIHEYPPRIYRRISTWKIGFQPVVGCRKLRTSFPIYVYMTQTDQKHVHSLAFSLLMISLYQIHSILRKEHRRTPAKNRNCFFSVRKASSEFSRIINDRTPYSVRSTIIQFSERGTLPKLGVKTRQTE